MRPDLYIGNLRLTECKYSGKGPHQFCESGVCPGRVEGECIIKTPPEGVRLYKHKDCWVNNTEEILTSAFFKWLVKDVNFDAEDCYWYKAIGTLEKVGALIRDCS